MAVRCINILIKVIILEKKRHVEGRGGDTNSRSKMGRVDTGAVCRYCCFQERVGQGTQAASNADLTRLCSWG